MTVDVYSVASQGVVQRVFWIDWFHKIPHLNLSLIYVNSTFSPFSPVYQESLGLIGSIPVAILILTLLNLLLYLLTRCCDNRPRTPRSITCMKVACVIFAICTLGALGVSVWGNEEVHEGAISIVTHLNNIDNMVQTVLNKTMTFEETIQHNLQPQLNLFKETVEQGKANNVSAKMFLMETLHFIQGNISDVLLINMEDIATKLSGARLEWVVQTIGLAELGRWASTLALTVILMMVVLIVPLGVGRHSRCTLIVFSVLGLLALIICWGLTSLYLVAVVAASDWCQNTDPFLEEQMGRFVSHDVAKYYLTCSPTLRSPFTRYLTHAQQAADLILVSLEEVMEVADRNYPTKQIHPRLNHIKTYTKQLDGTMGDVGALLQCHGLHHQYLMAVSATCFEAVSGLVYLLLSAFGSAIMFTILVWLASHTWIYLNHKHEVCTNEERDPFLPGRNSKATNLTCVSNQGYQRPRHSHTPPQTPPFPGTLNGRGYVSDGMGGCGAPPSTVSTMGRDNHHRDNHHRENHHRENHHRESHHHHHSYSHPIAPNQGQYATLSKQCKTLESSDFY